MSEQSDAVPSSEFAVPSKRLSLGTWNSELGTGARPVKIFEKCDAYTVARLAQAEGIYPYFTPVEASTATEVLVDGEWKIMVGSNNYLGLTHHPRVLDAQRRALERYGSGATGSRFLNGTLDLHNELEQRFARFFRKEAALVFTTGYQASLGAVGTFVGRDDHLFLDKLDHASIVDGSRLSIGEVHENGAGTARHFGVDDQVDLIMATFSKSLVSVGGVVAGPEQAIHYLRHHSRALIFTASAPPASVAGVLAALDIMEQEPERRVAEVLRSLGFDTGVSETPIIPVFIGGVFEACHFWRELFDLGVFAHPIVPPAVPAP